MSDAALCYTPGTCSLAPMVVLAWLDRPHLLCRVSGAARRKEAFLRLNPHGQVPVLVLGDRALTESASILLALADAAPEAGLVPAPGTAERDALHYWLAWLDSAFHAAFWPVYAPDRYHPHDGERVRALALERVAERCRFVDAQLAGRATVLPGGRSVLDPFLHSMARWSRSFLDLPTDYPSLHHFLEVTAQEPAVARALAIEKGDRAPQGAYLGEVPLDELAGRASWAFGSGRPA